MTFLRPSTATVWRAFYTRPHAERRIEARLKQRGVETYVPMRKVKRQWSDRVRTVEEPLFRGYLFAHVNERQRLEVLQDEGVIRCLSLGGKLAVVRDDEIVLLRQMTTLEERIETMPRQRFPTGQRVTIVHGPLAGREGFVLEHRRETVFVVQIDSVELAVRVQLHPEWLALPAR